MNTIQNNVLRFLRPNLWKILLTIALLYVSSTLWRAYVISRISDTFPWGFPLQFYLAWGPCPPGETCYEANFLYLIIDLVFWYVLSAFVVSRFARSAESKLH